MISVEQMGLAPKESEFLGVAIVDGYRRSDIHHGRSTVFRVEAGEHTVVVYIKRRFRVDGYWGRAKVSLPVWVEPGEHLDLVFGVFKEKEQVPRPSLLWFPFLFEASPFLALGIGWHSSPHLRDAIAWLTLTLGVRQPWFSFLYFFVSSRWVTACFAVTAWMIVLQLYLFYHWKRIQIEARGRASAYYLCRRADGEKPAPLYKTLYVDPFE